MIFSAVLSVLLISNSVTAVLKSVPKTNNLNSRIEAELNAVVMHIVNTYLTNHRCIMVVTEPDAQWKVHVSEEAVVMSQWEQYSDSECISEAVLKLLEEIFVQKCSEYIIQLRKPICFLQVWETVRKDSIFRHSPKLLFLPTDFNKYSDELFSAPDSEFISDMLAVEVQKPENELDELRIHFTTNNFYEPMRVKDRHCCIYLGEWHHNISDVNLYPDKISDLRGKELLVATIHYPPYSLLWPFDGMEIRLLNAFCQIHNCTLGTVTDDMVWGEIYDNKTGNGIMGNVYMDKADFGVGSVYMWESQWWYVEYTEPYLSTVVTVLVPRATQMPDWMIPLLPFTLQIWAAQVVSIVVAAVILFFIHKLTKPKSKEVSEYDTFSGNLMRATGMALLQPPASSIRSASTLRIFFTLFEILFLLFTTVYAGALSSVLTVPSFHSPINDPVELYDSGIKWAGNHDAWVYSLYGADEPHLKGLVSRFFTKPSDELMSLSYTGQYGFAFEIMAGGDMAIQDHLTGDLILRHHVMRKELYSATLVALLRKGSPYKDALDVVLRRSLDGGLLLLWEYYTATVLMPSRIQTALKIAKSDTPDIDYHPTSLKLKHMQGAFFMWVMGLSGAAILLVFEKFFAESPTTKFKGEKKTHQDLQDLQLFDYVN